MAPKLKVQDSWWKWSRPILEQVGTIFCILTAPLWVGLVVNHYYPDPPRLNPIAAIRPFETLTEGVICTAWSVQLPGGGLAWMTAYHCIHDPEGNPDFKTAFFVSWKPVTLLMVDKPHDLALLKGYPQPGLALATVEPTPLTPIWGAGYPMGATHLHIVSGTYSGRDDDAKTIYGLAVAPGMSGGPVLDTQNRVVGLYEQQECMTPTGWCAVSRGVTVGELRTFLGY